MSLYLFLTVVQGLIAGALVVTILMQRSEGGGLGIGGSPNGMMSARGAANFLSRATKWLAVTFVVLSIVMAAIAAKNSGTQEITSTIERNTDPLAGQLSTGPAPADEAAVPPEPGSDDPLADVAE